MPAGELVRYDTMCRAIAEAYEIDEIKDIRDKAAALEHYARQARNNEAERQCAEIRLRAERKAGQLLRQMKKANGAAQPGVGRRGRTMPSDDTRALSDLGITYDQSSQWQKLADVPEPQFEAALVGPDKPTLNGIIGAGRPRQAERDSDAAARLWFWLRGFDDYDGMLSQAPPREVARGMTSETRDDLRERVPRIIAWLQELDLSDA
jgi:hypothetical protein